MFGDFYSVTRKEDLLLKDFVYTVYPILKEKKVLLKIAKLQAYQPLDIEDSV